MANFGDGELKDLLAQLSIDGQNKEQKLVTVSAKGGKFLEFSNAAEPAGAPRGAGDAQKAGLAGNATTNFTLDAQDKIKVFDRRRRSANLAGPK